LNAATVFAGSVDGEP